MRTSESVPVQFFHPAFCAQFHTEPRLKPQPDLIVLAHIAADLMQWIDCSWIVGLARFGGDVRVACVMGAPPDLQACFECVTQMLRRPLQAGVRAVHGIGEGLPVMISPIRNAPEFEPVLAIGPKNGAEGYSSNDRGFVTALCDSVGSLLGNTRLARAMSSPIPELDRVCNELETAQEVQDRFLPWSMSQVPGLDYHGCSERCGCLGGDFFGFFHPNRTELLVTLGRVAPVGAPAALLAAGLQATLRTLIELDADLAEVLRRLNRMMWEVSPGDVFASLFCARVIPAQSRLLYVSAGQETVLLLRARDNRVIPIESSGAVLGLSHRSIYVQRSIPFEPGDTIIAATEGVTDAVATENLDFSRMLPVLLQETGHNTARDSVSLILETAKMFSAEAGGRHDRTVTVVHSQAHLARHSSIGTAALPWRGLDTRAA